MTRRTDRVNALLREEIATLLRDDLHDPRVTGLVTVTHVDVSPDLRHAEAHISVLGSDADRASTMRALQHARPFFRRELGRRLHLRTVPDVEFVSDTAMEQAQELTDQMRRNAQERGDRL